MRSWHFVLHLLKVLACFVVVLTALAGLGFALQWVSVVAGNIPFLALAVLVVLGAFVWVVAETYEP